MTQSVCIRKVHISILARGIGNSEYFRGFRQCLQANSGLVVWIGHNRLFTSVVSSDDLENLYDTEYWEQ
jgi:hypothetical protein